MSFLDIYSNFENMVVIWWGFLLYTSIVLDLTELYVSKFLAPNIQNIWEVDLPLKTWFHPRALSNELCLPITLLTYLSRLSRKQVVVCRVRCFKSRSFYFVINSSRIYIRVTFQRGATFCQEMNTSMTSKAFENGSSSRGQNKQNLFFLFPIILPPYIYDYYYFWVQSISIGYIPKYKNV